MGSVQPLILLLFSTICIGPLVLYLSGAFFAGALCMHMYPAPTSNALRQTIGAFNEAYQRCSHLRVVVTHTADVVGGDHGGISRDDFIECRDLKQAHGDDDRIATTIG